MPFHAFIQTNNTDANIQVRHFVDRRYPWRAELDDAIYSGFAPPCLDLKTPISARVLKERPFTFSY